MAVEETSPMVCTAWTMYIRIIMTMASGWNSSPKWKGTGTENQDAACRLVKSTTPPMASAAPYPTTMPMSMPEVLMSPLPKKLQPRVTSSVRMASSQNLGAPKLPFAWAAEPPPM